MYKNVFSKSRPPGGAITGNSGKFGAEVHLWVWYPGSMCKVWNRLGKRCRRLAGNKMEWKDTHTDGHTHGRSAKHRLSPAFGLVETISTRPNGFRLEETIHTTTSSVAPV